MMSEQPTVLGHQLRSELDLQSQTIDMKHRNSSTSAPVQ
jgi:hypothetical protein